MNTLDDIKAACERMTEASKAAMEADRRSREARACFEATIRGSLFAELGIENSRLERIDIKHLCFEVARKFGGEF